MSKNKLSNADKAMADIDKAERKNQHEKNSKIAKDKKIQLLIDGKGPKAQQKRFNSWLDNKKLEEWKQKKAVEQAGANVTTRKIPIVKT